MKRITYAIGLALLLTTAVTLGAVAQRVVTLASLSPFLVDIRQTVPVTFTFTVDDKAVTVPAAVDVAITIQVHADGSYSPTMQVGKATAPVVTVAQLSPTPQPNAQNLDEFRAQAVDLTFEQLVRDTESYIGNWVILKGQVVWTLEGHGDSVALGVYIIEGEYMVLVNYAVVARPRLLEGDYIEFLGQVEGRRTYTAVDGSSVTVPEITAYEATILPKE